MKVALLAAGLSKRMGGTNKLLEPVCGKPVLEWSLLAALSYSDDVTVITGHMAEETGKIATTLGASTLFNPDYGQGQETSLKLAVKTLGCPLIVLPADMPLMTKEDYLLCERNLRGTSCCRACHKGIPGHPAGLGEGFMEALLANPDTKVRDLMKALPHHFYEAGPDSTRDVDTPDDLRRVAAILARRLSSES